MSWKRYLDYDFENDLTESERRAREMAVEEDLVKAKELLDGINLNNSREVSRMYVLVKERQITFRTNRVRDEVLKFLAEKATLSKFDENERGAILQKTKNGGRILMSLVGVGLILASVALMVYGFYIRRSEDYDKQQLDELRQQVEVESTISNDAGGGPIEENLSVSAGPVSERFLQMKEKNQDTVGWLQVMGTSIDYPVMKGEDNEFYLKHSFNKESNRSGSIFMDCRNQLSDINLIIYGHNMANGTMFGGLNLYRDKNFYENHKDIRFETEAGSFNYRVIAVCIGQVLYIDEEGFRYYNYTDNVYEIDSFYNDLRDKSIYEVDYEFTNRDRYITLSTCNEELENGRLYVVAVRVE